MDITQSFVLNEVAMQELDLSGTLIGFEEFKSGLNGLEKIGYEVYVSNRVVGGFPDIIQVKGVHGRDIKGDFGKIAENPASLPYGSGRYFIKISQ